MPDGRAINLLVPEAYPKRPARAVTDQTVRFISELESHRHSVKRLIFGGLALFWVVPSIICPGQTPKMIQGSLRIVVYPKSDEDIGDKEGFLASVHKQSDSSFYSSDHLSPLPDDLTLGRARRLRLTSAK